MVPDLLRGPFTVDDYHRLGELGILHEDDRVELIDGQVVLMSPIGSHHSGCVIYLTNTLIRLAGDHAIISSQNPFILNRNSEPQPDLLLLKPNPSWYADRHPEPSDILLLIEVADSSLGYDRGIKLPRYARDGVQEYWIVDLAGEALLIHRQPSGDRYVDVHKAVRGDTVQSQLVPAVQLAVSEILR